MAVQPLAVVPRPGRGADLGRLGLGTVAGLLTAFNLVTSADPWTRVMCAYLAAPVVATVITGALSHAVFVQLDSGSLHELLRRTEQRRTLLDFLFSTDDSGLSWAVQGALGSLIAIFWLILNGERDDGRVAVLTVLGVTAAWVMMVLAYTVDYARANAVQEGLEFPGVEHPVFSDYVYQSLTVATSVATSDADITSRSMRRLVSGNAVVAFVFNTVIVALLVSLVTSFR
ncbi:DUF1345 domain-containing protein [Naumannella halotolerans]|uniref:Putative membrane protein n=1 Tax=Naumannella halotolerans TaxID=993414 RepID=A0A4R7J8N9_9ACTN|nr:DUF1345 domain-containing protein [Naumannella halotolerans]TDT32907.1 putative membrane protein [Naumannella halotolerans]